MSEPVLRLEALRKSYNVGEPTETEILHGISFEFARADFAALVGPSGSGKSTLLNLLGLLDTPTSGELYLLGHATRELDDEARTALRAESIGFVFQFHHLIPAFTARENVLMPLMVRRGRPDGDAIRRADELLVAVGLADFRDRPPKALSGGQQQRVAIARALIHEPALLLADEPTGNLDTATSHEVMEIFAGLREKRGLTIVVITHERDIAAYGTRTVDFRDGLIVSDRSNRESAPSAALV